MNIVILGKTTINPESPNYKANGSNYKVIEHIKKIDLKQNSQRIRELHPDCLILDLCSPFSETYEEIYDFLSEYFDKMKILVIIDVMPDEKFNDILVRNGIEGVKAVPPEYYKSIEDIVKDFNEMSENSGSLKLTPQIMVPILIFVIAVIFIIVSMTNN